MASSLSFQKILAWLMTEVMFGRAHFAIVRGLKRKDRGAVLTAPTFFEMTLGAHADSTHLCAARIFDRTSAASMHTLISSATKEKGSFKHATVAEVHWSVSYFFLFVKLTPLLTWHSREQRRLAAPRETAALTGQIGPGTNLSGKATNRPLTWFWV